MYKEKIIQFGEGGFLRGFVDWMVQILNEETEFNGSVVVVQPLEKGLCSLLEEQNCNYNHIMRGIKNGVPTIQSKFIDSISRTVEPYKDFGAYLSLAAKESFRFIVSNTTEAGIVFDENDTPSAAPYVSFPAKVTLLLKKRFDLKLKGFIFLPCELIDNNGENLKNCIIKYAKLWGYSEDFIKWVEEENIFCNTLVDRIVTGYPKEEENELKATDKMLNTSELFHLWVIETNFDIFSEIPFNKTALNVIITKELERYRTRKVRILNGAHTSMIPYALLLGVESVKECMENETLSNFVKSCVLEEIIPTLDSGLEELTDYANDVFQRFNNPFIHHLCSSISLNSISKFKVRVLPSLLEYINRFGKLPKNLVFSLAKLIEFYKIGNPIDEQSVIDFIKTHSINEVLANKSFWGEDISFLTNEVEKICQC